MTASYANHTHGYNSQQHSSTSTPPANTQHMLHSQPSNRVHSRPYSSRPGIDPVLEYARILYEHTRQQMDNANISSTAPTSTNTQAPGVTGGGRHRSNNHNTNNYGRGARAVAGNIS